jgi:O-antigen/teichoic acid export membrane protein
MLPVYTRYLSPVDYGILEILELSMSLFGMFLNMGMTAALLRYYGAARTAEEKKRTVSTALIFVTATGLVMFLLTFAFVKPVSAYLFGPSVPSTYLLLSLSSFILGYIANLPHTYLRALEASGRVVILDTASIFVVLLLNILFVTVLKIGLAGILLSSLIVNIAWIGVTGWTVRQVGIGFSKRLLRQMAVFGFPLIFSNLAMFTLNFADRFFLKHFRSLDEVGIYAVAYKFGFLMNFLLVQPFYGMWQARMYVIHGQPDDRKIFSQVFMLYAAVLTYAGLALSLFSPEIVHLMVSAKFAFGQDVIPLIVLAYIFYGLGYYVQLGMFLTNNTKMIGMVSAAAAVLNLALNYFLIQQFGMVGAAWATMLSFMAIMIGSYWLSQRVLPLPLQHDRVAIMVALATAFYAIARLGHMQSVPATLLMKTVLLLVFPCVVWKGGILGPSEIETIASAWHSVMASASRLLGWTPRRVEGL